MTCPCYASPGTTMYRIHPSVLCSTLFSASSPFSSETQSLPHFRSVTLLHVTHDHLLSSIHPAIDASVLSLPLGGTTDGASEVAQQTYLF